MDENSPSEGNTDGQTHDDRNSQKLDATDTVPLPTRNHEYYDEDYLLKRMVYVKSAVGKDETRYNMNHKKRGRCVIFNNDEFDLSVPSREGSEKDVVAITRVFQDILGFEVMHCRNFTSSNIHNTVISLSQDNFEDEDCLCVFILTHGSYNDTLHAHDCTYSLKSVWQRFTGDKCHSLVGKPKLFFIQACRGEKFDNGIGVYSTGNSQTDSVPASSYKIPTHADILLAHSTVEVIPCLKGFSSWRNEKNGTYYIQQLCEVIEEHWETHDLTKMLTITARLVANEYSSVHNVDPRKHEQKQMPSITSTLTRDVCFTKKDC